MHCPANLGRCCYEKAVLAFCYGYKQCQLAARFVDFKIGIQFRLRRQQDLVSRLEADLIQKCFQESVATPFDRICRLRLAGTGVEPEYCEAACNLAAFL